MIVTYKKDRWSKNQSQEYGPHDKFEKGEAWNPKYKKTQNNDGKAIFQMSKKDKKDKNETQC